MFFDTFKSLCQRKEVSCSRAAAEIGLSNSITTKWKKTGAIPDSSTLSRVADYFGVTTDYLIYGDDQLFLNYYQQDRILDELEKKLTQKNITEQFAICQAKASSNIFTYLRQHRISGISMSDLFSLAHYLDADKEIERLIQEKAPTLSDERKDILDEIDFAFYGDFKELTEDDKETLRTMARVMRERRAKKQE